MDDTADSRLNTFYATARSFLGRASLEESAIVDFPFGETEAVWCAVFYPELYELCRRAPAQTTSLLVCTTAAHALIEELEKKWVKGITNNGSKLVNACRRITGQLYNIVWKTPENQWRPYKDNPEEVVDDVSKQYTNTLDLLKKIDWYLKGSERDRSDQWALLVRAAPAAYTVLALLHYQVLMQVGAAQTRLLSYSEIEITGCPKENLEYRSMSPPSTVITKPDCIELVRGAVRVLVAALCQAHLHYSDGIIDDPRLFLWAPVAEQEVALRAPETPGNDDRTDFVARGLFSVCDWVPWVFYYGTRQKSPLTPAPTTPQDTARIRAKLLEYGDSRTNVRRQLVAKLQMMPAWDNVDSIAALSALHATDLAEVEVTDITTGTTRLVKWTRAHTNVLVVAHLPRGAWPVNPGKGPIKTTQWFVPTQRAILLKKAGDTLLPNLNKDDLWLPAATPQQD